MMSPALTCNASAITAANLPECSAWMKRSSTRSFSQVRCRHRQNGISDHILLKPGGFTRDEWKVMKEHSLIGAKILGNSKSSSQARQYQIGTVISQLPDLSEPASQPQLEC